MAKDNNNIPPDDELPDDFFEDGEDENDEDGEDFDFDMEEDDYNSEEAKREYDERQSKIYNHPVYKQAEEVYRLTESLVASLRPKKGAEFMEEGQGDMLMNAAMMLRPKLAGAINSGDYVCAMQNAAIIRDHAELLRLSTNTLHHFTEVDRAHCKLHRAEMEKFRKLFCEWMNEVRTYEKYGEDEWNVF